MKARLKSDLLVREIAGEIVLLGGGKESTIFSKMLVLNESAALLVNRLMEHTCSIPDDLVDLLLQHYAVDYEEAHTDVDELIGILKGLNVLDIR